MLGPSVTVMIRKQAILRWTLAALFVMSAFDVALGADKIVTPHAKRHTRIVLPPGLPRPHYDYRTTVIYAPAAPVPVYVEDPPLISPPTTPILPGSSTLPGNYGRPFDYYYQGAYYGDDGSSPGYTSYFFRLPYACGVTGYC
jgi:hypothetical protein